MWCLKLDSVHLRRSISNIQDPCPLGRGVLSIFSFSWFLWDPPRPRVYLALA